MYLVVRRRQRKLFGSNLAYAPSVPYHLANLTYYNALLDEEETVDWVRSESLNFLYCNEDIFAFI